MTKTIIISILGMLLVFLISCSGEKKAETQMEQSQETEATTSEMTTSVTDSAKATCPSCGMVMDKSEMVEYVSDGDTVYFCSEECKTHYLAEEAEEPETEE